MFKNKKLVISLAVGLVVVLAAVGYFVATPAMQVGGYKQQLTTAHEKVGEAVEKLIAVQDRDAFVKSEVESSVVRNDVKAGQDAIKDIEAALADHEAKLTNFTVLPFLDWNAAYKTATQLKAQEQDYIKNARDYVAEMKAVLTYFEQGAVVTDKAAEAEVLAADMSVLTSVDEINVKFDQVIKKYDEIVAEAEKMSAPESLAAMHNMNIAGVKEIGDLFKQSAAAFKAEDYDKVEKVYATITTKLAEYSKKIDNLNAQFAKESKLAKLRDTLKNLNREIESNIVRL